jgi:hypothetical protein
VLLADEFWLLAHDDVTGRPRLSSRVLGLGLAGALIGELVDTRNVVIQQGVVHLVNRTPPPDALTHTVLDQIDAEVRQHPVRTWLAYLSRTTAEMVAQRLQRSGMVRRESSRRVLKQVTVYRPVDANRAAWPTARLSTTLRRQAPLSEPDAFLVGLAAATGLDQVILDGAGPGPRDYLAHVVASLPASQHQIVSYAEAAVGDAVLTQRS